MARPPREYFCQEKGWAGFSGWFFWSAGVDWGKSWGMYDGDSFFTLSLWGRAGLLAVSLGLAVLWIFAVRIVARAFRFAMPGPLAVALSLVAWAVLFFAFVWLSPQGYYAYYRLIIDDLPAQWVIKSPPLPGELWAFLSFSGRHNLSAHSTGVLGWVMLLAALWPRRR